MLLCCLLARIASKDWASPWLLQIPRFGYLPMCSS